MIPFYKSFFRLLEINQSKLARSLNYDRSNLLHALQGKRAMPEHIKQGLLDAFNLETELRLKPNFLHIWKCDDSEYEKKKEYFSYEEVFHEDVKTIMDMYLQNYLFEQWPLLEMFFYIATPIVARSQNDTIHILILQSEEKFYPINHRKMYLADEKQPKRITLSHDESEEILFGNLTVEEIWKGLQKRSTTWTWDMFVYEAAKKMSAKEAADRLGLTLPENIHVMKDGAFLGQ